jgi:tetratricopeptide (TPR) repeat protein
MMKRINLIVIAAFAASTAFGQNAAPSPTPVPLSAVLSRNFESAKSSEVTPDQRRQAYAKLFEGQRFLWTSGRLRSQTGVNSTMRLARDSFQRSVEIDPTLAEGYTALAELAIGMAPGDADEAVKLAEIAVKADGRNFGARRILARLYTYKSKLTSGSPDQGYLGKAADQWEQVTRLDPRNAEAWAFLSEIFERQRKQPERLNALKKWLAAASAIDTGFYRSMMGSRESLAPESARLKLGEALLKAGQMRDAVETLSVAVADDPDNFAAVDMLREAIETTTDPTAVSAAISALTQAVYASPHNISLVNLLATVEARGGRIDEAEKLLKGTVEKLMMSDRPAASVLQMSLGDIYANAGRGAEALASYEAALKVRGTDGGETVTDDEREFAVAVFERMIKSLKASNRPSDVRAIIERARKMLGNADLFADKQLISFYRESGMRADALAAVRKAREAAPGDSGLLRMEATLLTEAGKVDEAVALIKGSGKQAAPQTPVAGPDSTLTIAVPPVDEFSNYIFIASLYSDAGRPKEATEAANQAIVLARGVERKQIARMTLATARQNAGDFAGAEIILREILKESPRNPIALNNLGYFLVERNERLEEALKLIQQSVEIDPTNPSFLDSLGWAYFKLGKLAEAEKHLSQASSLDAASATIQEHLGDVYEAQGRGEQARYSWTRALKLASAEADVKRIEKKLASNAK